MDNGLFMTVDCTILWNVSSMTLNFIGTEGSSTSTDGEWRYWALEDGEHVKRSLPGIDDGWTWDDNYKHSFVSAKRYVQYLLNGMTKTTRWAKRRPARLRLSSASTFHITPNRLSRFRWHNCCVISLFLSNAVSTTDPAVSVQRSGIWA